MTDNTIIRKYGGSSLSTIDKIKAIAKDIAQLYKSEKRILLVVSAMGGTTNELLEKAKSICENPNGRELDMLLSTGERVSGALLAIALNDLNVPATSFTGSQAGIITTNEHTNAEILEVTPYRIAEVLDRNEVVILAGFQGVSRESKDITTLGRGGTDTSAVALAHYFKADRVEMKKDVDGVYNEDPNQSTSAKHFSDLSHDELIALTDQGAKIIHHKAALLAKKLNVKIEVSLAHGDGKKTIIK